MMMHARDWLRKPWALPAGIALLLALPAAGFAQEIPQEELPDTIAERVVALHNAPGTTRFTGELRIANGSEITGNVAVVGGPVVVAGRVAGTLVVINGVLTFEPGATVTGEVLVVGGSVNGADGATIAGGVVVFAQPLRFRQDAEGLIALVSPLPTGISAGRDFGFGRTDIRLGVHSGYNRVEGLPIAFGPRVRFGHRNPALLQALVIYRTAARPRFANDELGFTIHAEQYLGGRNNLRVGVRLFSEIAPIEPPGLSDRENSLATFVLHQDFRDFFESEGWTAYMRFARPGTARDITLEYRDQRHHSVAPAGAWSIFDDDDEWRPNPVVAEGTLRSLAAVFRHDTRNEEIDPAAGWDVRIEIEQGLGGGLDLPAASVAEGGTAVHAQDREGFTALSIDLRRYVRLAPYARMAVRALATGSLDGTDLPAQRQKTLGGEATLPGYRLFEFDCGARASRVSLRGRTYFPYYGCDRVVLVQLEYQAGFPFARRLGRAIGIGLDLGQQVRWAAFFDAGRAWNEPGARAGRGGGENDFSADAGLGLRFGQLGLYWAVPLSGRGQGLNFFVRLGRRL
jgi:hypothetical protein